MTRNRSKEFFRLYDGLDSESNCSYGLGGLGIGGEWANSPRPRDPVDLLPTDPFEMDLDATLSTMDLDSTITAAITGWIGADPCHCQVDGGDFVTGLGYCVNKNLLSTSMNSSSSVRLSDMFTEEISNLTCEVERVGSFGILWDVEDVSVSQRGDMVHGGGDGNYLHDGLLFSLRYLGVKDLLSLELVCKSFRSAVQGDALLWRCIHIEPPLSESITGDDLCRLTDRAQGSLLCLSLVGCSNITIDDLMRVLCSNPGLKMLNMPGYLRLDFDDFIYSLNALKSYGMLSLIALKLGRIPDLSQKQIEELKLLVGADDGIRKKSRKLHFYHNSIQSPACEDDRAVDIEFCPRCKKYRLVFDCPLECCRSKGPEHCRACSTCILRCFDCGRCIENCIYWEVFFYLENLCSDCFEALSR